LNPPPERVSNCGYLNRILRRDVVGRSRETAYFRQIISTRFWISARSFFMKKYDIKPSKKN